MESGGPESASPMTHRVQSLSSADTRGKHRIHAELKRLEQEARFLEARCDRVQEGDGRHRIQVKQLAQDSILGSSACRLNSVVFDENVWEEELEQLERMEKASTSCKIMLINVETKPDPLLPSSVGPLSPTWDRWFEGPQDSKSCCRCWIL
ncbi:hypothetical protein JHK84_056937 [Glycine max]|nr:hypothetical protein JHK86_056878 [Glycine max]KAG4919618.1 hypothetical protein JHK85_057899 [Glycine max]KAG5075706.1 hypothetical protein JHK84_056937 [Glycine max]